MYSQWLQEEQKVYVIPSITPNRLVTHLAPDKAELYCVNPFERYAALLILDFRVRVDRTA